jgi:hypothetical protein
VGLSLKADEILRRVEVGGSDEDAHQLLDCFFAGYPLENLRALFDSSNEPAVKAGAWIASELGTGATPLLPFIRPLLRHESRYVRFFGLDVVLACAGWGDGALMAEAIGLIRDLDDAIKWKAMMFLARATTDQLAVGKANLAHDRELRQLTQWLMDREEDDTEGPQVIRRQLTAQMDLERLFAVVAAARGGVGSRELLTEAAASQDPRIQQFAQDQLRLLG